MTNKIKRYISPLIILLTAWLMTGCLDDTFGDYYNGIGKGDANIRATVEFENLTPALETRAPGNAVGAVSNLQMVIYRVVDGKTEFFKRVVCNDLGDYRLITNGNSNEPGDIETGSSQTGNGEFGPTGESTDHADFTYEPLPYGRYKIYAVANVPLLNDKECETEETLKSITFKWKENVADNNAMFGYFTPADDQTSATFDAPIILVNSKQINIHAWIKRLVSKVTVAFDPSGLEEAVTVYIKSVTLHDIPKYCTLGKDNSPKNDTLLIKNGESIKYYTDATESDYRKWDIILQKGSGIKGSSHSNSANALYFFENMQGDFEGNKAYLKQQIDEETGTAIDAPGNNQYGDDPKENDYKDRVPYGTYVEVVAYYVSNNAKKLSAGHIRYRFMLGKNITYNYDAQRNYHYKLTLKLRGFANEADWHISYSEPSPTIFIPDPFNVSYLYGQYHALPIRVITADGMNENYYIRAEITENGWYPTLVNTDIVPSQTVGDYNQSYGFAWNEVARNEVYKGKNYPGFLSMRKPEPGELYPNDRYGTATDTKLENYYNNKSIGYGAYSLDVGTDREVGYWNSTTGAFIGSKPAGSDSTPYSVRKDDRDGSVTLTIPIYTRQRSLATSTDFSGSNPFWAYTRSAKLKITLWTKEGKQVKFKDSNENSKEVSERVIDVHQVRRIENPTAIYRKSGSEEPFTVTLLYLASATAPSYSEVTSEGAWRASILTDPDGLIKLTGNGREVINTSTEKYIEGSTGTKVQFTYTPRGGGSGKARCGIIYVEYHDYTCNHYIFVRQGYDTGVYLGNANWSCYQVYATGKNSTDASPEDLTDVNVMVTQNPLNIGSMYKRLQYNYGVREANLEDPDNYGWLKRVDNKNLSVAYLDGSVAKSKDIGYSDFAGMPWVETEAGAKVQGTGGASPSEKLWEEGKRFTNKWADKWHTVGYASGQELTVPTADQYLALMNSCEFGFGIAYADGAKAPETNRDLAIGFRDDNNDNCGGKGSTSGVRVCIAYNRSNGNNIIFPLGSISQGRRARQTFAIGGRLSGQTDQTAMPDPGAGSLTYSGIRTLLYGEGNLHRPLTYNIYRSPGAIYWIKQPKLTSSNYPVYASWDINYYTSSFNHYDYGSVGNWVQSNATTGAGYPSRTYKWVSGSTYEYTWTGVTNANCSDALPIKLVYTK